MNMDALDKTEYLKVLSKYGYGEKDFELTPSESDLNGPLANEIGMIIPTGYIDVRHVENDKNKSYQMFDRTSGSWLADFEVDLKEGYFGK